MQITLNQWTSGFPLAECGKALGPHPARPNTAAIRLMLRDAVMFLLWRKPGVVLLAVVIIVPVSTDRLPVLLKSMGQLPGPVYSPV